MCACRNAGIGSPLSVRYRPLDSGGTRRRREEAPAPARRNRWRRNKSLTGGRPGRVGPVPDVLRHIALSVVDEPVLMTDVGVPDNGVHPLVSGFHRRISRTPGVRSARGDLGLGSPGRQPETGDRKAGRHQRPGRDLPLMVLGPHAVFSLLGRRFAFCRHAWCCPGRAFGRTLTRWPFANARGRPPCAWSLCITGPPPHMRRLPHFWRARTAAPHVPARSPPAFTQRARAGWANLLTAS